MRLVLLLWVKDVLLVLLWVHDAKGGEGAVGDDVVDRELGLDLDLEAREVAGRGGVEACGVVAAAGHGVDEGGEVVVFGREEIFGEEAFGREERHVGEQRG